MTPLITKLRSLLARAPSLDRPVIAEAIAALEEKKEMAQELEYLRNCVATHDLKLTIDELTAERDTATRRGRSS